MFKFNKIIALMICLNLSLAGCGGKKATSEVKESQNNNTNNPVPEYNWIDSIETQVLADTQIQFNYNLNEDTFSELELKHTITFEEHSAAQINWGYYPYNGNFIGEFPRYTQVGTIVLEGPVTALSLRLQDSQYESVHVNICTMAKVDGEEFDLGCIEGVELFRETGIYSIGGTVSNLQDNVTLLVQFDQYYDMIFLENNGTFTLPGWYASGTEFEVYLFAVSPAIQSCAMTEGGGVRTVGTQNITDIKFECN
ncbi:MAG TPA: hypothetical protein PKC21_07195 [Oligoflexia bacterium]|nr:hypothetical protein [Oligoflexia bacterium]HMR25123.1 hypothetical protein [Oligoflexia bacterium]